MTQEEKAKAYDKALIKIRPLYERAKKDDCPIWSTYEYIFPVLRESEDERIRKCIRLCLDECVHSDIIRDYERDECIAYLEKQKEPMPIPDKFSGLKSLMLQYLQAAANRKDDAEIESDTDLWGRKILYYVWKYDGLQGEQKSAEWSEEDEKIIQSLILEVNKYVFFAGIEANKIVSFLKSLRPSWKPSEEQIDALERAIVKMHTANDIGILAELRDNLRKLM